MARAGLVLLHGRGGSARDIARLPAAAGVTGVALRAPEAPGQSWWPTSFLAPAAVMEPHVTAGIARVAEAVAALEGEGVARGAIWLVGFSQGACLALEAFARIGGGLAGAFGFAGGLVGTADGEGGPLPSLYGHIPKRFDYPGARTGAQVRLSVHAHDPHIPLARVEATAAALRALGAEVTTVVHPGAGHGITDIDLAALRAAVTPA